MSDRRISQVREATACGWTEQGQGSGEGIVVKRRWIFGALALVLGGSAVIAAVRSTKAPKAGGDDLPFRVGKVQSEDLQVSVREVAGADPVDKVDGTSAVSGRVTAIRVREGDTGKVGEVLA